MGPQLLKAWRKKLGLSQPAMGDKLGVSQVSVCDWENDKKTPCPASAKKIAKLSRGAVPADSWRTAASRKANRERIHSVDPDTSHS